MEKEPKTNTENENLRDQGKGNGDTTQRNEFHRNDNTGTDSLNDERTNTRDDQAAKSTSAGDSIDDTDKYLAMEQPGVTYTDDTEPSNLSDEFNYKGSENQDKWKADGDNGEYSDAFNQDNYILTDNVDLDEDQNQSISSDDEDFEESNERYTN